MDLTPMRTWSLISVVLVCASCTIRVPRLAGQITVHTQAQATVHVQARAVPLPPPPPPPPPAPLVEIRNAPVVEFFGVPLEGAADIVFVLDCSGSMDELAHGRIAMIAATADPNAAPPEPMPATGAPDPNAPPPSPDPNTPPPDPNIPPPDPNAPPPAPPVPAGPRKIEIAQQELVDALQRLPAGTAMNVLFFNDEIDGYAPNLVPLQEAGRQGLITFVRETEPSGKTALVPAMRAAFLMNARRIVLLSDGLGNVGGGSNVLLEDMREAIRSGVRIDAIGLGADQDAGLLSTLAAESGGLYQAL
jgi:hypothetical protein